MFETIVVSVIASTLISIVAAFLLMRRYSQELQDTIKPQFDAVKELVFEVQGALDAAKPQITRSQSIIAQHGVTPRQVKTAERMVSEDLIDKFPEIKFVLGSISPRTSEYFDENPDILLELAQRWGPKIKALVDAGVLDVPLMGNSGQVRGSSRGIEWGQRT